MRTVQRWLRRRGLQVSRASAPNRFQAIEETISALQARGYAPETIVDAGANRGQFFELARPLFPHARFHLIEPQAACVRELEQKAGGEAIVYQLAVTAPGTDHVRMVGGGPGGDGTGNWVAKPEDDGPDAFTVQAVTLDALLDAHIERDQRALLKLDLESHELPALRGATSLLERVEVVLTEVAFYDPNGWGAPLFGDLLAFLSEHGFSLYELASLSGRSRDGRLRQGDAVFLRTDSPLARDASWE